MRVRIKHFATALRFAVWLSLLAMLYLILWLQGGPRHLDWAQQWLLEELNPPGAPFEITMGDLYLDWKNIADFGHVRVTQLQVAQKQGMVFATIPRVEISLDALGFLPRHRAINGIIIDGLSVMVARDAQGIVRLGAEGVEGSLPLADLTAYFASGKAENDEQQGRLPFRTLELRRAALTFSDAVTNTTLVSNPLSFSISRRWRNLSGRLIMPFRYNDVPGGIEAQLSTLEGGDTRVLAAKIDRVPMELACLLAQCPADYAPTGPVSGKATLRRSRSKGLSGDFALTAEGATITAPSLFPKMLKLTKGGLIGSVGENLHLIEVDAATFEFPDVKLALKGMAARGADGWRASGEGLASKLSMKKLYRYWPLVVAPDTRQWVINHITAGVAEKSTLTFDLLPEDLNDDTIRDEGMRSTIVAKGIEVKYIPGFPPVKAMDGVVTFTGKTMHVDANAGALLTDTRIHSALLDCKDLDNPKAPMTTTIKLTAPAGDVATMLKLPPFTFDDGINLDPKTITGSIDATMKLGFDGFSGVPPTSAGDVDFSNVAYDIDAVLSNLAQPKLLDGRDISGLSGTLKASDQAGVNFDGTVKLDGGTNVALTLKEEGGSTVATAKGTLARSQFKQFGIPEPSQLGEGSIGIDAQVALGDPMALKRAAIDLTPIALHVPELGYRKKAGEAGSLALTPNKTPHGFDLSVKAADLSVMGGAVQLNAAMDGVAALSFSRLKTSRNDFALSYKKTGQGFDVKLTGARLDYSESFAAPSDEPGILADFPPINLDIDLGKLVLVPEQPLKQLKGTLRCDQQRCSSADLRATAGEGTLHARILNEGNARRLEVTGSNAGDLLRALDISDRMFGGTLELKGGYDDGQTPPAFSGRVIVQRFKMKNSEILARIISIGSLSGLMNALTGAGIDFKKLSADVDAKAGVFKVKKGQLDSNALGLTASGTIDTAKRTLNLKGVVVPANSLNSLFGKIPLIGKLAGEGDALIGFNYSVKGGMGDPDVFVNPLSGLTPGFLRGIFTLGDDADAPASAPEVGEQPKAEGGEEKAPNIQLPKPPANTPKPKP